MSSSDLFALAILPAVLWGSRFYVVTSASEMALKLRAAGSAKTKRELMEVAKWGALYVFIIYFVVLICLAVWNRIQEPHALGMILTPAHWERGILHGIILGLALVGSLLIFRRYFPEGKQFGFLVMAGIGSPPWVRACALLFVAFTEELWRAICLTTLTADGFSGPQAVLATSVAYGFTYLGWRYPVAISDGIVGAVYGGLFLWSGSFFVPFAAHLIFRGQHLLYAIAATPDAEPGDIQRRPHTKCPACGTNLALRQINLNFNEAFFCPACHARITISDERRGFFRWGFVFVGITLMIATFDIFPGAIRNRMDQYWASLAVTVCAGLGVQSFFQVLFPPKLVCGDPDFISLNLGDKDAARPIEKTTNEKDDLNSK